MSQEIAEQAKVETPEISWVDEIISKIMRQESHLSFSSLSQFAESPKDFIQYKLKQKVQTPAMIFGQLVHCLILEPGKFEHRYYVVDDRAKIIEIGGGNPRNTNKYKEYMIAQRALAAGREVVDWADFQQATLMANQVKYNKASGRLMAQVVQTEKEIFWEYGNFKFKGFIDGEGEKIRIDIKTVTDASPKAVQREIINNRYYLQAAMYNYAAGPKEYYIIAVDRAGGVSVHHIHTLLMMHGMEEYDLLVNKFNECVFTDAWNESYDFWSDRYDGTFIMEKPRWMF
jgi:hypothetical protein